ncbi:hypothetical protein PIN31009_04550 [Pandoraea iniqua]|uniref:Uncharacterized protein n=1 Tax=Pandoraea iniqua TaxID=2508288 RepID=A0A5E4YTF2_9BURK|nr:hypothetical protein PIN31009_04550 [Pandoraea iniqua]VVE52076.1 hypothetical protein PIN31115_04733 [Pandoraea iniqua]
MFWVIDDRCGDGKRGDNIATTNTGRIQHDAGMTPAYG